MITVSNKYKQVMDKMIRNRAYISIAIGVITQEAQASAQASGDFTEYTDLTNVFSNIETYDEYATFEENFWRADGTQYLLPKAKNYIDTGLTTNGFLGAVKVSFDNVYALKGLTVNFGSAYPTEFKITTSTGEEFFFENDEEIFRTPQLFGETEYLIITPITMLGGQQRMRIHSMLMGVGISFTNKDVEKFSKDEYMSAISEEISSKTFNVTVFDLENNFNVDDDNSFINFLEQKQEITTSFGLELDDGTVEWINGSKTYLAEWKSTNGKMSFTSTDILSQMDDEYEQGNMIYERTAYEEAESIFADLGLEPDEYYIDDYLRDVHLINPMPVARHSECLQILAMASRSVCFQEENGRVVIRSNFSNVVNPEEIHATSDNATAWSNANNTIKGASMVYVDLSNNFYHVNDSMNLLPENEADYALEKTGYVSAEISDENGIFQNKPTITYTFDEPHTYFSIQTVFNVNHPKSITVKTYTGDRLKETVDFEISGLEDCLFHEWVSFDKMVIEFNDTFEPHQRINLSQVAFGMLSDYTLTRRNMMENPIGFKEQTTKSVSVRVCTFELDSKDVPRQVNDDVWTKKCINPVGVNVNVENPLIDNEDFAYLIAEWIADYYKNNVRYEVKYRGEPRIACGDIIGMESDIVQNMQAEIGEAKLNFNGGFSGSLLLRKVEKKGIS